IDDELPKVHMKTIQIKRPKIDAGGGAFHEKSAKNKKVNVRKSHKDEMMKKYGKPKKRGGKK
ncbi:MAG: ATP-dependent helicase, partial [Sediminibacterium sp.]